ncbi:beta-1,4-glucuronyltransferase 1 [Zeugodacus cucurbitae]|uniref:Beta-1,4-glucuronyltransferase 1 n=1 Tax=Zeugodacus cucurbitae TaxID=28588 RepID=A0A0A1WEG2_ZEUCU|nr:beta-1,4-glucuronyltransferase 1 [Zeugodacus cucurbitae]
MRQFIRFRRWVLFVLTIFLTAINLLWTFCLLETEINSQRINKSYNRITKKLVAMDRINNATIPPLNQRINQTLVEKNSKHNFRLAFDNINFETGRWDNHRHYKMYDFALIGDKFIKSSYENIVCLATQSSVERLYSLTQVAHQWNGPISTAVYVAGNEEFFILQHFVTYMRLCFSFIRDNVTFHIAVPSNKKPVQGHIPNLVNSFDCQYPEQTLRHLLKIRNPDTIRWRLKNEYPQNHLRNLARKGCQNKYVFLTDIDIIPSANMVSLLNKFLPSVKCSYRCAYVIPTFEIDNRAKFPASKPELMRLYRKGLARPFHEKVFIYNQYATNFSIWLSNSSNEDDRAHISHVVTNFEFLYEPFYVAFDDVPAHDERFIGYGFTRNSQVYEMFISGYTFFVLSPVFTCHWGLQQKKARPVWREQQNNLNRKRFEMFKHEILARYKKKTTRK